MNMCQKLNWAEAGSGKSVLEGCQWITEASPEDALEENHATSGIERLHPISHHPKILDIVLRTALPPVKGCCSIAVTQGHLHDTPNSSNSSGVSANACARSHLTDS